MDRSNIFRCVRYLSMCAFALCTMDARSGHPLWLPFHVRRLNFSMLEGVPHDEDRHCNIDVRGATNLACACPISVWCLAVALLPCIRSAIRSIRGLLALQRRPRLAL